MRGELPLQKGLRVILLALFISTPYPSPVWWVYMAMAVNVSTVAERFHLPFFVPMKGSFLGSWRVVSQPS